jgi:hypothetical protein
LIDNIDFGDPRHASIFGGKTFNLKSSGPQNGYKSVDPINDYSVEDGYRSNLFASDILVGGCSFTFGLGVPKEATWWSFVAKNLGKSVSSVALPGMSIGWIIEQIFVHFRTYGHPETLLCFFPDLGRMRVLLDGTTISSGNNLLGDGNGVYTVNIDNINDNDRPKYLKKPYNVDHIHTFENSVFQSIRCIRMLEQYCNATGIEFLWSTWNPESTQILDQLVENKDFSFENYFSIYDDGLNYYRKEGGINRQVIFDSELEYNLCITQHKDIECSCGLDCHSELLVLYGPDNFYLGADILRGVEYAHPGIHLQAHFGDAFLKQLELSRNKD